MLDEGEKITIPKLIAKTGLSRGFFYKNPIVRSTLDKALEQQVGMTDPRKNILDMAMDNEIVVSFFNPRSAPPDSLSWYRGSAAMR